MVKGSPPKTFPSLSSTLLIRNQRKTAPARQISSCVFPFATGLAHARERRNKYPCLGHLEDAHPSSLWQEARFHPANQPLTAFPRSPGPTSPPVFQRRHFLAVTSTELAGARCSFSLRSLEEPLRCVRVAVDCCLRCPRR